jgi:hypothetical protein
MRLEVFATVGIRSMGFWYVTLCSSLMLIRVHQTLCPGIAEELNLKGGYNLDFIKLTFHCLVYE